MASGFSQCDDMWMRMYRWCTQAEPAAIVFLTSKPPDGLPPPVDPEPAHQLCGYRARDVYPEGLPFPVLDPENDSGSALDPAKLATAWTRAHLLGADPLQAGVAGFVKDDRIVIDVPPDEFLTPAPDHR
jgi:hypothetical protein